MSTISKDQLKKNAWDKAFEACATQGIFEKRALRIKRLNNWKDFIGIFVPAFIGITAMSIKIAPDVFEILVGLSAIPLVVQLGLSIWSLVAKWNDGYVSCIGSIQANNSLRRKWEDFANEITPATQQTFNELMMQNSEQERVDLAKDIDEKEKRYGMRYGLRQYQRSCVQCLQVPPSLKSTECGVCGNF